MSDAPVRYRSAEEDNERWLEFPFRPGDIVISTRSKSGTTCMPIRPEVTYVVVARHPLDMAVSLHHQGNNLDRERIRRLTGAPEPNRPMAPRPPLREWLISWMERDADPSAEMDSLPGGCGASPIAGPRA